MGAVKLAKGAHRITFKMHSDNNNHGMLDCFVFTNGAFMPEGTRKPGEKSAAGEVAAEGRWAFQPPRDEFSPKALLDLRSLNEKFAGEHGFVTRSEDGNDFAFADGTPARFWRSTTGPSARTSRAMPASWPSAGSTWSAFTATSPPPAAT